MSTNTAETWPKSKRSGTNVRAADDKPALSHKPKSRSPVTKPPTEALRRTRVTKHGRLLTLLSRPDGASIAEMMQATDWQQHSVRGFLAGTVKKKLGLELTSSKASGEARRYRIVARRGR
jgi:molybdenum cofactor biosynthesis enzyme MoaA